MHWTASLSRWLMPAIPQRIKVETLELFWADGAFDGAVAVSVLWLTVAVIYLLFRRAR